MRNPLLYGNYTTFVATLRAFSLALPTILINVTTDIEIPVYLITLIPFIVFLIPSAPFILSMDILYKVFFRPGAYIWALVCVANGPQDAIAIIFYVIAALQFFSILKGVVVGVLFIPDLFL